MLENKYKIAKATVFQDSGEIVSGFAAFHTDLIFSRWLEDLAKKIVDDYTIRLQVQGVHGEQLDSFLFDYGIILEDETSIKEGYNGCNFRLYGAIDSDQKKSLERNIKQASGTKLFEVRYPNPSISSLDLEVLTETSKPYEHFPSEKIDTISCLEV